MDEKSGRPETRSQTTSKTQLSEAEIEIIQKRVLDQQERLSAEMQALRAERDKFEREMETAARAMKEKKEILHQKEIDAQKWKDMAQIGTKQMPCRS
jgi:septin family protein